MCNIFNCICRIVDWNTKLTEPEIYETFDEPGGDSECLVERKQLIPSMYDVSNIYNETAIP